MDPTDHGRQSLACPQSSFRVGALVLVGLAGISCSGMGGHVAPLPNGVSPQNRSVVLVFDKSCDGEVQRAYFYEQPHKETASWRPKDLGQALRANAERLIRTVFTDVDIADGDSPTMSSPQKTYLRIGVIDLKQAVREAFPYEVTVTGVLEWSTWNNSQKLWSTEVVGMGRSDMGWTIFSEASLAADRGKQLINTWMSLSLEALAHAPPAAFPLTPR